MKKTTFTSPAEKIDSAELLLIKFTALILTAIVAASMIVHKGIEFKASVFEELSVSLIPTAYADEPTYAELLENAPKPEDYDTPAEYHKADIAWSYSEEVINAKVKETGGFEKEENEAEKEKRLERNRLANFIKCYLVSFFNKDEFGKFTCKTLLFMTEEENITFTIAN